MPESGGMFCLDGAKGTEVWFAQGVRQFVSMSPTRVYTIDVSRRLMILDAKTGARLDTMPLEGTLRKLHNEQTDRIYLVGANGLVQCLHETNLDQPTVYAPPALPDSSAPEIKKKTKAPAEDAEKSDDDGTKGAGHEGQGRRRGRR